MIDESLLTFSEKAMLRLRALFEESGYKRFAMSRFEEYDLYARYKDFLVSERIISFTDLDGRLMALKPDVTLSVLLRAPLEAGPPRKVYYHENVFRAAPGDRGFREIPQTGVECIGALDFSDVSDVVLLAARALAALGGDYRLCVSHLGLVTELMAAAGVPQGEYRRVLRFVREKNGHSLAACARDMGLAEESAALLGRLTTLCGPLAETLPELAALCGKASKPCEELSALLDALAAQSLESRVRLDFSVVNNMDYYDGVVFQGYLAGLPAGMLSGGEYGSLARLLGRETGAVGFAVYLDALREVR